MPFNSCELEIELWDGYGRNLVVTSGKESGEDPGYTFIVCGDDPPRTGGKGHGKGYYACLTPDDIDSLIRFLRMTKKVWQRRARLDHEEHAL